ncbi:UNVERIFIED_CONTAM: hypothetical protein GTU68_008516 [Idotea baltica]|nr:hypothetical protein [Idotea baltica]
MEVEELKEEKQALATEAEQKTQQMQEEHSAWQDRIRNLLGKMDDVE